MFQSLAEGDGKFIAKYFLENILHVFLIHIQQTHLLSDMPIYPLNP